MTTKTLTQLIEDMLLETDKLALCHFMPDTPEHELQLCLIKNAARYRLALYEKGK